MIKHPHLFRTFIPHKTYLEKENLNGDTNLEYIHYFSKVNVTNVWQYPKAHINK